MMLPTEQWAGHLPPSSNGSSRSNRNSSSNVNRPAAAATRAAAPTAAAAPASSTATAADRPLILPTAAVAAPSGFSRRGTAAAIGLQPPNPRPIQTDSCASGRGAFKWFGAETPMCDSPQQNEICRLIGPGSSLGLNDGRDRLRRRKACSGPRISPLRAEAKLLFQTGICTFRTRGPGLSAQTRRR